MLQKLIADRRGNFGLITAIVLPVLLGMAGLGVDFARTSLAQSNLQNAADAAAVGALAERSPGVAQAMAMTGDGTVTLAQADAVKLFTGQMHSGDDYKLLSVDAKISKTGKKLTASVSYKANVPTTLMQALGKKYVQIAGTAVSEYQTQTFRDFYLLLDNTPSMGVAATPADVAKMVANTSDQCAFACHINNAGAENNSDYYHLAKRLGVTIRIDVVAQATAALMDTAVGQRSTADQFRMAIYTFGQKAEDTKLLEVSPLTVDLASAKQKAAGIQLMTIPYQGYNSDQQTSFDTALAQIQAKMGAQGDGATAATAEKTVFFVTDGVGDSYKPTGCTKPTTGGRCQEPIDLKFCTALKNANYKIAILYTTYLPLTTNSWYNTWIKPFQSQIGTNLKSCASDGLYFEVSPTEGISDAMNTLFMRMLRMPRLTG